MVDEQSGGKGEKKGEFADGGQSGNRLWPPGCLASAGSPFDHLVDRIDASINISAHNWANPSH